MTQVSADEIHQTAARRLRGAGQRYTDSRRALVEVLAGSDRPLTLPEILTRAGDLAQSSAYRNLAGLIEAEVVARVVTAEEHGRFELSQDLTEHHHHLVCTHCGRVDDFTLPEGVEVDVVHALSDVAARRGFTASHHQLDLVGRCERCR